MLTYARPQATAPAVSSARRWCTWRSCRGEALTSVGPGSPAQLRCSNPRAHAASRLPALAPPGRMVLGARVLWPGQASQATRPASARRSGGRVSGHRVSVWRIPLCRTCRPASPRQCPPFPSPGPSTRSSKGCPESPQSQEGAPCSPLTPSPPPRLEARGHPRARGALPFRAGAARGRPRLLAAARGAQPGSCRCRGRRRGLHGCRTGGGPQERGEAGGPGQLGGGRRGSSDWRWGGTRSA